MQIKVEFNSLRTRVSQHEAPTFTLLRVDKVSYSPDKQVTLDYSDWQPPIGKAEWERLIASQGDIRALFPQLKIEPPLPDFDRYWKDE
jgi:hypothetical protein